MSQELPQDGKFIIQTIGPVKTGISKSTQKPYKVYELQFEGDPNWYGTYWTGNEDPQIGKELSGKKSYDDKFNSYKFEIARDGGKGNWNPAGANATVFLAAATAVGNFLALDPKHLEEWASKRKPQEPPFAHYLRTVKDVAGIMKDDIVGLGSIGTDQKAGDTTSTAPTANGQGAVDIESYPVANQPGTQDERPIE